MKRILFFIFALQLFNTINTYSQQSGWVWQNPKPQGNDATDIKMFNSGTGYCRTDYSILKTTNFGTNWSIIFNDEYVGDIYFINEQTGYHSKGNQLYKTLNGGSNWFLHYTFIDFTPNHMIWQNELTGYSMQSSQVGSIPYYGTRIRKSTNGGVIWQQIFNDTTITIYSISFPSVSTGYLAGNLNIDFQNAKLFKSINAGLNWDSISISNIHGLRCIHFINDSTGYVTGSPTSLNGPRLLRTTNGFLTWDSVYFGPSLFSKFEFINFNTGYGYNGNLSKTTNAGVNWIFLNPYLSGLNIRDFTVYNNGNNIYVSGYKGQNGKSTNGGLDWTANSRGFYGYLTSIKFFDANTGIASGYDFVRAAILRTTNSGIQWDTMSIDNSELNSIHILNQNTAFIAGTNKVYKTTNKGASFLTLNTNTLRRWDDISFPNENTGYVINKYKVIDKTTDGGNVWTNISPSGFGDYFTICFINGNTGFFGGSKMFRTTNGGVFWDTVNTGLSTDYFCNKIRYINSKLYSIGYILPTYKGIIMKSTDEGLNWQIDSIPNENFYDISIPSPNLISLIGSHNYIYKSINNSAWIKYNTYTTGGYSSSICFVNNDTGFISTYNGGILKTTNGGGEPIGINPLSNEIPTAFSLYQNYPNPFNPTTIIEYSLPKNSLVTIKVYDLLGRLVKQIVNENQSAGNYFVNFDGSIYASGVYFYRLETDDLIISKKMVLIK